MPAVARSRIALAEPILVTEWPPTADAHPAPTGPLSSLQGEAIEPISPRNP